MYVSENSLGTKEGTIVVTLFSDDWRKSYDKQVTKAELTKLKARKNVNHVSWMQVLTNSNEKSKRGIYAPLVQSIKEL